MSLRHTLKTEKAKERYDRNFNSVETTFSQKELEEHDKEIRAKAIDEFAEKANKKITEFVLAHKDNLDFASGISVAWNIVDEIAEQIKAGGKNE